MTVDDVIPAFSSLPGSAGDEYHLVHISPDELSDNSSTTPPPTVMTRKRNSPTTSNSGRESENSDTGSPSRWTFHCFTLMQKSHPRLYFVYTYGRQRESWLFLQIGTRIELFCYLSSRHTVDCCWLEESSSTQIWPVQNHPENITFACFVGSPSPPLNDSGTEQDRGVADN